MVHLLSLRLHRYPLFYFIKTRRGYFKLYFQDFPVFLLNCLPEGLRSKGKSNEAKRRKKKKI